MGVSMLNAGTHFRSFLVGMKTKLADKLILINLLCRTKRKGKFPHSNTSKLVQVNKQG